MHHRIDDSPDDIDMDLDQRFRPNNGMGGRIILLGDGTEISTDAPDSDMFDHEDEDKDLDSQVDKYNNESNSGAQVTESPSSVQTEKSEKAEPTSEALKDAQGEKKPLVADKSN